MLLGVWVETTAMMPFSYLVVLDVSPRVARMLFFSSFSQTTQKTVDVIWKLNQKQRTKARFSFCVCVWICQPKLQNTTRFLSVFCLRTQYNALRDQQTNSSGFTYKEDLFLSNVCGVEALDHPPAHCLKRCWCVAYGRAGMARPRTCFAVKMLVCYQNCLWHFSSTLQFCLLPTSSYFSPMVLF